MKDKNRFKVLSTQQVDLLTMTDKMRRDMDLQKLEARRDEIIGFNNDISTQIENMKVEAAKVTEEFNTKAKLFNENYAKLTEQYKVNLGALSEVQNWIETIKKKEEVIEKSENVVSIDKNKKEK